MQKTVAGHPISEKDIFALCGRLQFNAVMRVLIVGCGYVGLPLGNALVRAGHEVTGLRRSRSAECARRAAAREGEPSAVAGVSPWP